MNAAPPQPVRLPPFMQAAEWETNTKPLATLSLDSRRKRWHLTGDPQVTMMAKRLFPGASGRGAGEATFPNTVRIVQDLIWLMQRFPIGPAEGHEKQFDQAVKSAQAHAEQRILAERKDPMYPGARFIGPEPYDHQKEGLAFIMANKRVLVADDMGLGKTLQAAMALTAGAPGRALIVAQPHLVDQWVEMVGDYIESGPNGMSVGIVVGRGEGAKAQAQGKDILPNADIIVMHYGLVAAWKNRLLDHGIHTVVFDEIGELRRKDSDKYNACSAVSSMAEVVIGLSGTPIYNYGDEIWAIMNAIDFQCLGPRDDFIREWCTFENGHHMVRDPKALNAYLRREGLMIRRRKGDELPPKHRNPQRIDADDSLFHNAMSEALPLLQDYGSASTRERFYLSGRINEHARQATGIAKVDATIDFASLMLQAGEPVVIFAFHHAVFDRLEEGLAQWKPVRITGKETKKQKTAAKHAFMTGESQAIIVSLRAATGIDGLQYRSRVAIMAELDWSPAIHAQAEDRLWRTGQDRDVMVYYMLSSIGSDPDMEAKLGLKVAQAKGILDDPFETEEKIKQDQEQTKTFVTQMIERLRHDLIGGRSDKGSHALGAAD